MNEFYWNVAPVKVLTDTERLAIDIRTLATMLEKVSDYLSYSDEDKLKDIIRRYAHIGE